MLLGLDERLFKFARPVVSGYSMPTLRAFGEFQLFNRQCALSSDSNINVKISKMGCERSEESHTNTMHLMNMWGLLFRRLVHDELRAIEKLVLRGTRIVVPIDLRNHILILAHEGHPGIVGPITQTICYKDDGTCTSGSRLEDLMSTRQEMYFSEWNFSWQMFYFINTLIIIVVCISFCLIVIIIHIVSIRNPRADMYRYPVGSVLLAVACPLQFSLTVGFAVQNSLAENNADIQIPWSLVLYGLSSFFNLLVLVGYFIMLLRNIKLQPPFENMHMDEIPLGTNLP